jgi:hypothetical protein
MAFRGILRKSTAEVTADEANGLLDELDALARS